MVVRNDPVQLGRREIAAECGIGQIDLFDPFSCFLHAGAPGQNPGNELKLGHILLPRLHLPIMGIAHKIQSRHGKALLVHPVKIQWIVIHHMGHADDGIMPVQCPHIPECQWEISGCDGDFLSIGSIIVQGSSEIKILGFVGNCRAHGFCLPLFLNSAVILSSFFSIIPVLQIKRNLPGILISSQKKEQSQ